ncbi:exosortase C-terminal domain/associated protein EpsI [Pelovirga terrestris]|uniref:EpsI family protein n=1 Tax=Pelovirga terrestris TaxID=2771352 RepID=A0A8J6QWQ6_9BACT|nr:exosortase C-terminal domain/associated protein EpsI [Pelovirga terrestris]MBD1399327.1 EpsI family protein [Pelovirga terrestris]
MTETVPEIDQHRQIAPRRITSALLLFVGFVALFYDVIIYTFYKWFTPEGNHWPLILGAALYIVWLKRDDIRRLPQHPNLMVGTLMMAGGCFMLFAAKLSNTIVAQQLAVIPVLLGGVLLLRGFSWFKALFIPICYLIFQTGIPWWALGKFSIYLQLSAAWLATNMIGWSGMPVILSGTIIDLPHIALEVAPECAGVSNIVSLISLSIFLGFVLQLSVYKKALIVLLSIPVGIFANGVRIALIGFYAVYNKGADLHGPYETMGMSLIFFFGMLLLFLIGHLIKGKKVMPVALEQDAVDEVDDIPPLQITADSRGGRRHLVAACLLASLLVPTLAMMHLYHLRPVTPPASFATFPLEIGDFYGEDAFWVDERIRPFSADDELIRVYTDPSDNRFALYVGYFAEQDRDKKVVDYRRSWMFDGAGRYPVVTDSGTEFINKRDEEGNSLYFWYILADRIVTDSLTGKVLTFWDGLTNRKTNGAVIIIQSRSGEEAVRPFVQEMMIHVQGYIQ